MSASWILTACLAVGTLSHASPAETQVKAASGAPAASSQGAVDLAQLFQAGQNALNQGSLDEAETYFRRALAG